MIIGITGNSITGKELITEYLNKYYGFTLYDCDDPIKKIAMILGFEYNDLYGKQKQNINETMGISGKEFLQKFGNICRDVLPSLMPNMNIQNGSIWVNLLKKFIEENNEKDIVISDIKDINEFNTLKKNNGIMINVTEYNNGLNTIKSDTNYNNMKCDYIIYNNKIDEELIIQINTIVNKLKKYHIV